MLFHSSRPLLDLLPLTVVKGILGHAFIINPLMVKGSMRVVNDLGSQCAVNQALEMVGVMVLSSELKSCTP